MNREDYKLFDNKNILITGGTGSFGQTVCDHFISNGIKEIKIFSRDEKKQDEMRQKFSDSRISFFIGDIRDYESVLDACDSVDYIFHAAALKQVPSCEFHPIEAVRTNVLGTENLIKASINRNVKKVVLLSTDKAVYPINSMGLSKAMMEKIMLSKSLLYKNFSTTLCSTRYGNVMGSRGSVIPLFIDQIKRNKPITITNPNMSRFMMSLDDAVNLVIYAFKNSLKGDIFVQKAPACILKDLVIAIKEIFDYKKQDKIIGTRHGEKLYESLLSREEMNRSIEKEGFYRVPPDDRDINYNKYFIEGEQSNNEVDEYNSHNTYRLNIKEIKETLLKLDLVKDALNE